MYFESWQALIQMNGHGPYVWFVYGVALVVLGALIVTPQLDKRRFFKREAQRLRREQQQLQMRN